MKALLWLIIIGCVAGIAFALWAIRRREMMRQRESEARSAALLNEVLSSVKSKSGGSPKDPGPAGPG